MVGALGFKEEPGSSPRRPVTDVRDVGDDVRPRGATSELFASGRGGVVGESYLR